MQNTQRTKISWVLRLGNAVPGPVRWALALAFTLLATVMLVQSSSQPIVGPPAPPGQPDLWRELELTAGHVVTFFFLVTLWWWTLLAYLPSARALFVAVGFALVFGLITELAQTLVSDRQASLFDVAVNWTVTVATATAIVEQTRRRARLAGQGSVFKNAGRMTSHAGFFR